MGGNFFPHEWLNQGPRCRHFNISPTSYIIDITPVNKWTTVLKYSLKLGSASLLAAVEWNIEFCFFPPQINLDISVSQLWNWICGMQQNVLYRQNIHFPCLYPFSEAQWISSPLFNFVLYVAINMVIVVSEKLWQVFGYANAWIFNWFSFPIPFKFFKFLIWRAVKRKNLSFR